MPARVANTPRTIPFKLLVIKFRLGEPKNKVCLIALISVLFNTFTNSDSEVFLLEVVEDVLLVEL